MENIHLVKTKISRQELQKIAERQFGDLVKAVVDIEQKIIAVGGELHADEEAILIEQGSQQSNLWGINIYPAEPKEKWIEYDSVINIRPSSGNRSRGVENLKVREKIIQIVNLLVE
jgi:hypothetical protein